MQTEQVSCAALRDRWQAAESPVRSLSFSLTSPLQLVSAGDDGRLAAWLLTSEGKLDRTAVNGRKIYQGSKEINNIALAENNHGVMVVSGGDDFQVRLHRLKLRRHWYANPVQPLDGDFRPAR